MTEDPDKKVVLLIDDNKDFLTLAEEDLESHEYTLKTIQVTPAMQVLQEVKVAKPDLIFLDVLFSKNFSNSLATQIRHDPDLKEIPIYLMSFLDLAEIEAIANKNEVNGCFMKPVKQTDIAELFKKHFGMQITAED